MTAIEAQEQKRGFWWWLTAILAPIGILGGPIAIAEMFKGFIDWHGPIQYVVHWWGEHISDPFHGIFVWLAELIHVSLPAWTVWVTDYFALGALLGWSTFRSFYLTKAGPNKFLKIEEPRDHKFLLLVPHVSAILFWLFTVLFWPLSIIWDLGRLVGLLRYWPAYFDRISRDETGAQRQGGYSGAVVHTWSTQQLAEIFLLGITTGLLTLAPFALFLVLWGLNFFLA